MAIKQRFFDIVEKISRQKGWVGFITSLAGICLPVVHKYGESIPHSTIIQFTLGLIVAAAGSTLFVPPPPPKAVKGLLPFIHSDEEVFKSLERNIDIQRVQQALDNESPLTVLIGEPVSGKSSLLRAGLIPVLKDPNVCYWQAYPDSVIGQLTQAIELQFKVKSYKELWSKPVTDDSTPAANSESSHEAAKPPMPDSVPAPSKCRVVMIDHFDFLRPGHHEPFFEFLEEICQQPEPYQLKFIIAFRKPYSPVWHTIRQRLNVTPLQVPIYPLDRDMAKGIMKTLLERAKIAVHARVIKAYVARFSFRDEVSPFAIGLGTLIFGTWARAQKSQIKLQDYFQKGGQKGVVADHVEQNLKALDTNPWEAIGAALCRKLVDSETGKRHMDGMGVTELAAAAGVNPPDMKVYLQTLSGADVRILERVDTEPQSLIYRLAQDCFVEVLQAIKAEGATTGFRLRAAFFEQFECWQRSKTWSKWKHLLSSQQLNALPPIEDLQQKSNTSQRNKAIRKYIRHSRVFRFSKKLLLGVLLIVVLAAIAYFGYHWWVARQAANKLKDGGLPGELYTRQESLDSLHIQTTTVPDFRWLHSQQMSELEISSVTQSLDGIENVPRLQILTLNLAHTTTITRLNQVGQLKELRNLTLFLAESHVQNLNDLKALKQLKVLRLSLDSTDVDFSTLAQLPALQTLILDAQGTDGKNLQGLAKLNNIKELNLNLSFSTMTALPDLGGLSNLTTMTLKAEQSSIRNFSSINALHSVKHLNLDLTGTNLDLKSSTKAVELPNWSNLHNLECLDLDFTNTGLAQLPPGLSELNKLKNLALRLRGTSIQHAPDLNSFKKLENVILDLDRSKLPLPFGTDPRYKYRGLESLKLESESFQTADIDKLNRLPFIHKLEVDLTSIREGKLPSFTGIKELDDLTVHLYWSQIQALPNLPNVTRLSLWVREDTLAPPSVPDASQLKGLISKANPTNLELHLYKSRITNLPHFGDNRIDTLFLELNLSEIGSLDNLSELKQLTKLRLELKECHGIDRLPPRDVLEKLTELILNAHSSNIANVDDLAYASQMQTLHIDLGDSKVANLPSLSSLTGVTKFGANFVGKSAIPLRETKKLSGIKEMTISETMTSIADLPSSVVRLNLGQLMSGELFFKKDKSVCHEQQ